MMRLLWAFTKRDFLIWSSYRLSFFWELFTIIGLTFMVFFIGQAIGSGVNIELAAYGGSYFEFALVGIAFLSYLGGIMIAFNKSIREGQQTGTLEVILTSPYRLPVFLISSSGFQHVIGLSRLLIYFLLGWGLFNLWSDINYIGAILVIVFSDICFCSLGLLTSAFTVAFKKGDPILNIYAMVNAVLGGFLFPVSLLPTWLQNLANYLPLTHSLQGIRLALRGFPLEAIVPSLAGLLILTLVFLPLGAVAFVWAVNLAKDQGSLVHY